ncbi:cation:proton antiporter [Facklamia sp. P12945]|uniref:cation:proton antiporter n=1 Tax=unclassified Facklamia TaxID=2622293 RepID=UPI003D1836DD
MLWSLGLVLILGWLFGKLFEKINLPKLLAYLVLGICLGPNVFNLLSSELTHLAGEIRQIALMIILIRAGLTLKFSDLIKVGRPAILMCFLPAICEILAIGLIGPYLLNISYVDSFLLASVLAAVSPAVLVPRMVGLIDRGLGTKQAIPQMILAGGTADDILIFVLFAAFMQLAQGQGVSASTVLSAPISVVTGIFLGFLVGHSLSYFLNRYQWEGQQALIVSLAISFLVLGLESLLTDILPYSGVLAVLVIFLIVQKKAPQRAVTLTASYQKIWQFAEIFLFVFLGVIVNPSLALEAGWPIVIIIVIGLIFRMLGVALSILKTPFAKKERYFIMGAYLPKATVQASLGGLPLMAGIASGSLILIAATVSILITAPLGAIFIDYFAPLWLEHEDTSVK